MSLIDTIKSWWIVSWLKKSPEKLPPPLPPDLFQTREVSFIDHFAERNSDPDTIGRHDKLKQAVSNAKAGITPWGRDG